MKNKKIYILVGLIFFGTASVLGLFIYPTYRARQTFKEKLKKDITSSFRRSFPDNIWNTINNADRLCFGDIFFDKKGDILFSEKKELKQPQVISEIKTILTNPYNYMYYQDWFIDEKKKIEKGLVILPFYSDFCSYIYNYPKEIRPSIFSYDKYIKIISKNQSITIIISEDSAQVIIVQILNEMNHQMTFNENKQFQYLVSDTYLNSAYLRSGKRVVMNLEDDAMHQLLFLLGNGTDKKE